MNKNNSVMLGIGAMLVLAVSLPLEWMTIHNAKVQFQGGLPGMGDMMSSSFGQMSLSVTGINGKVTFLVEMPIWLIVVVGLVGILLALLNCLRVTSIPRIVPVILLLLSALYVVMAMVVAVGSPDASVGIGLFVALLGVVLGIIHALSYRPSSPEIAE